MKRENIILGLSVLAPFLLGDKYGGANKSKPIKLNEFKQEIPYCSTDKFYLFEDQVVKKDVNDKITYYFRKPSAKFKKLIEALTFEDASIEPLNTEEAYAWHHLKPRTDYMKKARHWSVYFDKDFDDPILMGSDGNRLVVESRDMSGYWGFDLSRIDEDKIIPVSQKIPAVGGYIKETKDRLDLFLPSLGKAISVKRGNGVAIDRGQPAPNLVSLDNVLFVWKKIMDPEVDCTLKRIKISYEVGTKKRTTKIESSEMVELTTNGQTVEFNSKFIPKFKDIKSIHKSGYTDGPFVFITGYSAELIMPLRRTRSKDQGVVKEQVIDERTFETVEDRVDRKTKGSKNDGITVVRVEKRRSRYGDKHHMRAMSHGRMFTPEVVGATVTLEGADPQALRTYQHVEGILRDEERKLGLFGSMLVFRNVYQSHKKPNMWEAQWDLS